MYVRNGLKDLDDIHLGRSRYSLANRNSKHKEDDRSELVFTFLDILEHLQPKFFMLENVPPFLTGHRHQSVHRQCCRIQESSSSVKPRVMTSQSSVNFPKTGLKTASNSGKHYKKRVMRAVFALLMAH